MIIDTHAHYDDAAFDEDREQLLSALAEDGIEAVVNVGASLGSTRAAVQLARAWQPVFAAVGVHPDEAASLTPEDLQELKALTADPKVVAVGEIGLDYHWDIAPHEVQKDCFLRQLDLAKETGLPVIIHSRDAGQDTWELIRSEGLGPEGGVMHCYGYSREMAKGYLDLGMFFGIGGVITFKNARKLVETLEYLPMDAVVLETDCPYLAPVPHRGERNKSAYLPLMAEKIAQIKGLSPERVIEITRENALRLYPKLRAFLERAD